MITDDDYKSSDKGGCSIVTLTNHSGAVLNFIIPYVDGKRREMDLEPLRVRAATHRLHMSVFEHEGRRE